MSDYPATSLAMNTGTCCVLVTIPPDLRQYFNGRKQLERSTGTGDLPDAKRTQQKILHLLSISNCVAAGRLVTGARCGKDYANKH